MLLYVKTIKHITKDQIKFSLLSIGENCYYKWNGITEKCKHGY